MDYQYKMVQTPPEIYVRSSQGGEAAAYLEQVVNEHAKKGWEFYRIDSIGVKERPGCIASLLGARAEDYVYYVITFRRQIGPDKLDMVISALNNLSARTGSVEQATTSPTEASAKQFIQKLDLESQINNVVEVQPAAILHATVIAPKAIVRTLPRTMDVKKELAMNNTFYVVGRTEDNEWVLLEDKSGWIETANLSVEGDISSLSVLRKR